MYFKRNGINLPITFNVFSVLFGDSSPLLSSVAEHVYTPSSDGVGETMLYTPVELKPAGGESTSEPSLYNLYAIVPPEVVVAVQVIVTGIPLSTAEGSCVRPGLTEEEQQLC